MRRRKFIGLIGGVAATWPLAAHAQQGGRMRRVGILMPFSPSDKQTNAERVGGATIAAVGRKLISHCRSAHQRRNQKARSAYRRARKQNGELEILRRVVGGEIRRGQFFKPPWKSVRVPVEYRSTTGHR